MIHYWKAVELEILDSENYQERTSACGITPSQTSNP